MLQTLAPTHPDATHRAGLSTAVAARRTQAMAGYAAVSLEARVASANPHELVMMLYRGLVARLREAHAAARQDNALGRLKASERALVIVEGLAATLDSQRGGSVAESLEMVYELIRARILAGDEQALADALSSAEAIAEAWGNIRGS